MAGNELLAGQIEYYRRRAAEYDATSIGDVDAARERFRRLIERLAPTGDVLEIACGTGLWTEHLAAHARTLTALDSAPEMIELARRGWGTRATSAAPVVSNGERSGGTAGSSSASCY